MVTIFNGFGCTCRESQRLNGVSDYDQITIGGRTYTVNQIVDKVISAKTNVNAHTRPGGPVLFTIKSGEQIGKVYSYLRPDQTPDRRYWLMFDNSKGQSYFVPADGASPTGLKDQGALTVEEELKKEKEAHMKLNEPVLYYFKKVGVPVILSIGAVAIIAVVAREGMRGYFKEKNDE